MLRQAVRVLWLRTVVIIAALLVIWAIYLAPFRNRNVYECEWGWGRNVPRMHFCFYFFDFRVACIKKTCLSGYLQRWRMARQYDFEPAKCSEHLARFFKIENRQVNGSES